VDHIVFDSLFKNVFLIAVAAGFSDLVQPIQDQIQEGAYIQDRNYFIDKSRYKNDGTSFKVKG
jgi:hypothetical protein